MTADGWVVTVIGSVCDVRHRKASDVLLFRLRINEGRAILSFVVVAEKGGIACHCLHY